MARTVEASDKLREERLEKMRLGALELFATRGLGATKISDIAKASGMSQGLIYHYYKNKEVLFTELIGSAFERLNSAAEGLESSDMSAAEKVRAGLSGLLPALSTGRAAGLYHLLILNATVSIESLPEGAQELIRTEGVRPYALMSRIMAAGQADGSLRDGDPDDLALLFWTTIKGLAVHRAAHRESTLPSIETILPLFIKEQ